MMDVKLIGPLHSSKDQQLIPVLETHAAQCLLGAILLAPEKTQRRSVLASQLWPGQSQEKAQTNLRQLLHRLWKLWPEAPEYLISSRQSVRWLSTAPQRIDVELLLQLEQQPLSHDGLIQYLALMRGPLLEGVQQRWLEPIRQQFALSRVTYMNRAVPWCRSHSLLELERRLLCLATECIPTDIELLERLSLLTLHLTGLKEVQQLCQRWRRRWLETVAAPMPPELELRLGRLMSGAFHALDEHKTSLTWPTPVWSPSPSSSPQELEPAPSELDEVLQLAVVLGPRFDGRVLHGCLTAHPLLIPSLERLIAEGILQEAPDDAYCFASDAQREQLYLRLSRVRRQALHARCARYLLSQLEHGPQPLEPIIEHLEAAGDRVEAGKLAFQALQRYRAQDQHERVITLSTWTLSLLPSSEVEARWTTLRARVEASISLRLAHRLSSDLWAMEALLPDMPEPVQARLLLARLRVNQANLEGQPPKILEACRILVELVEAYGSPHECCYANLQYVTTLLGLGHYQRAAQVLERTRLYAQQAQDPEQLAHVELLRAGQLMRHLRLREARDCLHELLKGVPQLQDEGLRVRLMATYISVMLSLGESRVAMLEARTLHTRLVKRDHLYYSDLTHYFLIRSLTENGHYSEALQELTRLRLDRPLSGDLLHRMVVNELDLMLRFGQHDRAAELIAKGPLPPPNTLLSLAARPLLASCALQQGELDVAELELQRGLDEARSLDTLQGEVELLRVKVRLLTLRGQLDDAETLALHTLQRGEPLPTGGRWPTWRLKLMRELLHVCWLKQSYREAWQHFAPLLPLLEHFSEGWDGVHVLLFQGWMLACHLDYPAEAHRALSLAHTHIEALSLRLEPLELRQQWREMPTQKRVIEAFQRI
ncbi:MAG: hypothetical protein ACKO6N_23220 [Myxococcota bacterium]